MASAMPQLAPSGTGEISLTIPDQQKQPSSPTFLDKKSEITWKFDLEASVHSVYNLNRAKSKDAGWSMVCKFVFPNRSITGETAKTQITSLSQPVDRSVTLGLHIGSYQELQDLVYFPLLISFYECLLSPSKDKKKLQEEKLELVGQTSVDMLPFLNGQTEIHGSWTVFPVGAPGLDTAFLGWDNPENPQCMITVRLSCPLIPPQYSFNVLTLTIHSCYSLPDAWIPAVPTSHGASKNPPPTSNFTFATAIPKSSFSEKPLVASNKPVTARPNVKNPFVKWPSHPLIVTDAIYMRQKLGEKHYLEETGNLCEPADWMHRDTVERLSPCIMVNTEFRCVLSAEGEEAFRAKAMSRQVWPVEVFELLMPEKHPGVKKKGTIDANINPDEPVINRHGVAYVNTKPLFYPGATRIQGAYCIKVFDPLEFSERTHRNSVGMEIARMNVDLSGKPTTDKEGRLSVEPSKTRGEGGDRNLKSPEPSAAGAFPYKSTTEVTHLPVNLVTDQKRYEDTRAYIYLEMRVDKPFVQSSPTKPIIDKVKQLITPVPPADDNKPWEGSDAENELRKFVEEIYHHIAKLYRSADAADTKDLTAQVQTMLTKTGDYHALKEQLKLHVTRMVRDKYGCLKAVANVVDYERLLSSLYNDLMLYARLSFARVKRELVQRPLDLVTTHTVSELRILALEAEMDDNFDKAESFMRKRTEISPKDMSVWKDLGQFYTRYEDFGKAESAIIQMLLDNYANFEALLLMGYVYLKREDHVNAATFFEAVTILYPSSGLAWTALGLFYVCLPSDPTGKRPVLIEQAYAKASNAVGLTDKKSALYQEFLQIREEQRAMETPGSADPNKLRPLSPIDQSNRPKTGNDVGTAKKKRDKTGGSLPLQSEVEKAREPKQEPLFNHLTFVSPPKPDHIIPLDNIFWCALSSFANLGLHILTNECVEHLSKTCDHLDPVFWRASVMSFIEQHRFADAEHLLSRLTLSDVETADIFALLGHVRYMQNDYKGAALNYRRALNLTTEISDPYQVYFRYGRLSQKYRHYRKARDMYLAAAALQGTPETWLGAGWSLYYLEDYENCEMALQEANYLDNKDARVWAYLALLSVRLGREAIAKRCYGAALTFGVSSFPDICQELKQAMDELDVEGDVAK